MIELKNQKESLMTPRPKIASRIISVGLALAAVSLAAPPSRDKPATPPARELTIAGIMRGEELVGTAPSDVQWSVDGSRLYFRWKKPGEKSADLYSLSPADPRPKKITPEEMLKRPPLTAQQNERHRFSGFFGPELSFDKTRTRALAVQGGSISLLDRHAATAKTLIRTDEPLSDVRFTFDAQGVTFLCRDNLFLLSLRDGSLQQLTSFSREKQPEPVRPGAIEQWYVDQQKTLSFEFGQSHREFGRFERPRPQVGGGPARKPFVLEPTQNLAALELTPDKNHVLFVISESRPGVQSTIVPSYVTRSGYTETIPSHPKAAETSWSTRAGIMSVATGEVQWPDYGQGERKVSPDAVSFSPDGKHSLVTVHSDDRKDAWLISLNLQSGRSSVVEQVHDEAWVGPLGFIGPTWDPSSAYIYYISEKGGYAHIYRCSPDGREKIQLTQGRFEVEDMLLSRDGRRVYFHSNEGHPGETHFYVMPSQGGPRTRLTRREGQNRAALSPDERYLAVLSSTANEPPELFLQAGTPGALWRQVTVSTTEEFQATPWAKPEVLSFKARDGADVYARLYKPRAWREDRPAVIFIHGAGYLQNAHKGWSEYFREYMFHNFLNEKGYLVFDVDYRGSSGYGRDFRAGIYRRMGGKDLDDIVDAARFLVKEYGAAAGRIGVYGGSYGGFLTLMALFKEGDLFRAGAALRPVTDWAHYHAFYTMDILNLPQNDPEAYKQSSPIYFAEGLRGALLICHGMVDTNVHFQDTVRLVQRLIELGKEGWQVAFYPVEGHSFSYRSSWTDEYKRIFDLFEKNLR